MLEMTSLLTSQITDVLWLKDNTPDAVPRPRVAAGAVSDTNLGVLGAAGMPSSAVGWKSKSMSLMSLMAISLSLVSPLPKVGKCQ
jgi:hypothetical protein